MSRTNGNIVEYSTQYIDNKGFNTDTELKSVEIGGTDGSTVNRLKINSDGSINASSVPAKSSDEFGITAISEDATYKYFWFEADDADYYIMRKNKTTKVFTFTKGTGGYTTVYVNETSGPSGSPTWGTRGATF